MRVSEWVASEVVCCAVPGGNHGAAILDLRDCCCKDIIVVMVVWSCGGDHGPAAITYLCCCSWQEQQQAYSSGRTVCNSCGTYAAQEPSAMMWQQPLQPQQSSRPLDTGLSSCGV
jgi:hypothetical protein